jgi:hypothetical protein
MVAKPTQVLALSAALVLAVGMFAPSSARNAYRLQAIQQYHLSSMTCTYCHVASTGGGNWNKFGLTVQTEYDKAKRDIGVALYETLKAGKDSDGDGYSDVLEVVAKTLPGDEKSKPTKTVAALEAELKALGGVDYFKKK